jgi:solute carrier family 35 protein E1
MLLQQRAASAMAPGAAAARRLRSAGRPSTTTTTPRAAVPSPSSSAANCSIKPLRPVPLLSTTTSAAVAPIACASAAPQQQQQQQQQRRHSARRGDAAVACAASSSGGAAAASSSPAPLPAWRISAYICAWYLFNIVFNILNKTALNSFPCPWLIATWQLAASGLFMAALWLSGLQPKPPRPSREFLLALLPVAFFHTVGHVSACVAFSQVAVSFTHVIKSAEPVFSVLLQGPILGTPAPPAYVWLSLVPIVAGCSLSAIKEVSFAWSGFNNAMISNLGMVLRNIYSKKSLNKYKVGWKAVKKKNAGGDQNAPPPPRAASATHNTHHPRPLPPKNSPFPPPKKNQNTHTHTHTQTYRTSTASTSSA